METNKALIKACRKAAAEGTVLLRNTEQILPFTKDDEVAIFGRTQIDYYRSGTGSGGAVNVPYAVNLLEGCRGNGVFAINEELANVYEGWIKENPFDTGGYGWACEPWCQKEMPISIETVKKAKETSNKAVIVIGRTAGEDKDNGLEKGSYLLTDTEQNLIKTVTEVFTDVVLLFNVPNIIDMQFAWEEQFQKQIKGLLILWQGGIEGGNAAADVLSGRVTPCGKMPDSIAGDIEDYSATKNHGGEWKNVYQEDIYVGYRYFETFAPDKVLVPFGYGLSYTQFEQSLIDAYVEGTGEQEELVLQIRVTNIGSKYAGKEVVQLYVEAPQGKLGRPKRELVAFAKTKTLFCMESQFIDIRVPIQNLATYDDSGASGYAFSYVLEAGTYRLFYGSNIRDTKAILIGGKEGYLVETTRCIKQCEQALAPQEAFTRMKPQVKDDRLEMIYEAVPTNQIDLAERIQNNLPDTMEITGKRDIKLKDVAQGKAQMKDFVAQLSVKELTTIVRGEGMCSDKVTAGTAAAFGGVSDALLDYGIPVVCCADGPSGIRMDNGNKATQVPIGTLLASTFDTELIEQVYAMVGEEMIANEIDTLLGPGINIHRHPLNGRNFEYFSEDPLLSGKMAAAIVRGLASVGVQGTMKHFACNSQETGRHQVNAVISERAARLIYLKAFEIGVKEGNAKSIMTSYNPLNGHWTASNYDLNTTILRKEWGFDGMVMTDWWAKMNDVVTGGEASVKKMADMVRAQNDVYMVVHNNGAEINGAGDDLEEALAEGRLTVGELQRSAMNICEVVMKYPAMQHIGKQKKQIKHFKAMHMTADDKLATLAELDNRLSFGDMTQISFCVEETGVYEILVKLMSPQSNIAQTVCNAKLNGELCTTFQTNGTEGQWMIQKLGRISLGQGKYEMQLEFPKAGMQVAYMELQLL